MILSCCSNGLDVFDNKLHSQGTLSEQLKSRSMYAAAQCAHAAVAVVEDMRQTNKLLLRQWEEYGSAKTAVKCPSQAELVSRLQRYSCDSSVT